MTTTYPRDITSVPYPVQLQPDMAMRTDMLTRTFGERVAIDRLTFAVPTGSVIGLVGPNGSGKSTLIRTLLGLIRPSDGAGWVLETPIADQETIAPRVGALIENPAYVAGLTARAHLSSMAALRGLPATQIDDVLATVGLTGRDREPVKTFSLGMKQRLGIAMALLPNPDLLILDEPTNGLDPAGIVEIRDLLRQIGQQGRTVIVSSHLMSEIQAVCDYVVVIRFGTLLYAGPMADLLAKAHDVIEVEPELAADLPRLTAVLAAAGWPTASQVYGVLHLGAPRQDAALINRAALASGITLARLSPSRESLESLFLTMTSADANDVPRGDAVEGTKR